MIQNIIFCTKDLQECLNNTHIILQRSFTQDKSYIYCHHHLLMREAIHLAASHQFDEMLPSMRFISGCLSLASITSFNYSYYSSCVALQRVHQGFRRRHLCTSGPMGQGNSRLNTLLWVDTRTNRSSSHRLLSRDTCASV